MSVKSVETRCIKTGLWGLVVTAVCCATPIIPFLLGLAGLAVLTRYLDYVLLPLLGFFLLLAFYGWFNTKKPQKTTERV